MGIYEKEYEKIESIEIYYKSNINNIKGMNIEGVNIKQFDIVTGKEL